MVNMKSIDNVEFFLGKKLFLQRIEIKKEATGPKTGTIKFTVRANIWKTSSFREI